MTLFGAVLGQQAVPPTGAAVTRGPAWRRRRSPPSSRCPSFGRGSSWAGHGPLGAFGPGDDVDADQHRGLAGDDRPDSIAPRRPVIDAPGRYTYRLAHRRRGCPTRRRSPADIAGPRRTVGSVATHPLVAGFRWRHLRTGRTLWLGPKVLSPLAGVGDAEDIPPSGPPSMASGRPIGTWSDKRRVAYAPALFQGFTISCTFGD